MTIGLLILHGLFAVALLGAITHQAVASVSPVDSAGAGVVRRYWAVNSRLFVNVVVVAYIATFILGSVIYPAYRLDVRIVFAEMQLGWAIGLFEVKEHWAALGLALLPLYSRLWKRESLTSHRVARCTATVVLAVIVWSNFLVGHLLNNYRGL